MSGELDQEIEQSPAGRLLRVLAPHYHDAEKILRAYFSHVIVTENTGTVRLHIEAKTGATEAKTEATEAKIGAIVRLGHRAGRVVMCFSTIAIPFSQIMSISSTM